jgi:phosphatidate cytidylyltransferase
MAHAHWQVLLVYLAFTLAATALAFAKRWLRPGAAGGSLWRKYPTYILLNLVFVGAGWLPHAWQALTALVSLLGGLASWEIARPLRLSAVARRGLPIVTMALVATAGWLPMEAFFETWLVVMLGAAALSALASQRDDLGRQTIALAGCLVYLPLCLAAYLWIWREEAAGFLAGFLYLTVATNDAFAQITGQVFGQRQLSPRISPSKTVGGAVGGMLFAGAMGAGLSATVGWSYWGGAIAGLVLGLAGLLGDLTASAWKRAFNLKDFSGWLGPHGGALDRFDGLIFAAPVFYVFLKLLG